MVARIPVELELQVLVNCPTWVLGVELRFSASAEL